RRYRAGQFPLLPRLHSLAFDGMAFAALPPRRTLLRGSLPVEATPGRPDVHLRENPHSGPRTAPYGQCAGARSAKKAIPAFAPAVIAQEWAGLIDTMPDIIPVISPLPGVEGLIVATGFSGHGFGIGPGAGRLVADMVCNETPLVDPSPFHISRFSDGTKIRIENWE
ncbi:NAD(P)/FAD-dependent oxidoreductase, partial [Brucella abortus]|uniref:NAD(P)/FAD-dependent oxidoreductase n=1 Tax=Brucella abortus TaxID=235 RepID=UPI001FFD8C0A